MKTINHIKDNLDKYKSKEYDEELAKNNSPFRSFKEELSYLLIAHHLFENSIQMVLISDHNTIDSLFIIYIIV